MNLAKEYTKIAREYLEPLVKFYDSGMDEKAGNVLLEIKEISPVTYTMLFQALSKEYGIMRMQASILRA